MDHQHVVRQAVFVKEVLATVVALFWQKVKGAKWQVIWCLRRPRKLMTLGLCVSLQCGCLTPSWWKEPWSRSCKWRRQVANGTKENFTNMPFSATRLSFAIPYLLFPSISYSSSSSSFFFSSSSLCTSFLRRFGKPTGPPSSPAGTCRTGTGLLLPQVPKYWQVLNYSQVTKLWRVSQDSDF